MMFVAVDQVDHVYVQTLRGIRDIHESGVNESNFHEVRQLFHYNYIMVILGIIDSF